MEAGFSHPIEAELAALFDRHGIRWAYEPIRFELEDGEFVPDFYLPDLRVFVECTVAHPRRVTRKNAKARAVGELYGEIVNVLQRRDFERFGLKVLRVDVDDGAQPGATHRRSRSAEQAAGARRDPARLGGLGQELGSVAPAKAE